MRKSRELKNNGSNLEKSKSKRRWTLECEVKGTFETVVSLHAVRFMLSLFLKVVHYYTAATSGLEGNYDNEEALIYYYEVFCILY
jgi:hypothetical protein